MRSTSYSSSKAIILVSAIGSFSKCNFPVDIAKVFLRNAILSPLNLQINFFDFFSCFSLLVVPPSNRGVFTRSPSCRVAGCDTLTSLQRQFTIENIVYLLSIEPLICHPLIMHRRCIIAIFVLKSFRFQNSNALCYKPAHLSYAKVAKRFIPIKKNGNGNGIGIKCFDFDTRSKVCLHCILYSVQNQPHLSSHLNRNRRKWQKNRSINKMAHLFLLRCTIQINVPFACEHIKICRNINSKRELDMKKWQLRSSQRTECYFGFHLRNGWRTVVIPKQQIDAYPE